MVPLIKTLILIKIFPYFFRLIFNEVKTEDIGEPLALRGFLDRFIPTGIKSS